MACFDQRPRRINVIIKDFHIQKMLRVLKNKILRNPASLLCILMVFAILFYIHNNYIRKEFTFSQKPVDRFSVQFDKLNLENVGLPKMTEKSVKFTVKDTLTPTTKRYNLTYSKGNYVKPTVKSTLKATVKPTVKSTLKDTVKPTVKSILKATVKPTLIHKMGHVNVHLWHKMCTGNIDSLRQNPLFPLLPSIRGRPEMPNELVSIMATKWSAQRIMGFLYPPVSGDYRFEISSATISEFWLSTSEDPEKAVLMARNNKNSIHGVNFAKGPLMPKSKPVHLDHGKVYYFEMIHGMNDVMRDQVQVRWMLPGAKDFTGISKTSLSTVIINDNSFDMETRQLVLRSPSLALQENTPKKPEPHRWSDTNFSKPFKSYPSYTRENLNTLKFANGTKIMAAFGDCDYAPSYLQKRDYKRFEGALLASKRVSDVFPDDGTDRKLWYGRIKYDYHMQGNTLIKETVVIDIVKTFMEQLKAKFPGEYLLANIVNVERKVDVQRGNRFFLELVLLEIKTKELQRLSEYVYQFKNSSSICKPKGFKWSPMVKINAILIAKNQGPWVVHYIKSMAQVLHATHEHNVHFIIVDYGNNGVNIDEELRRNGIKNFTLIKRTGKFHKTLAIDDAKDTIKDDNSIIFLTDLHLDVPNNIFESVRKHTIQGKMVYTPLVFRLTHCGRPEGNKTTAAGYWEIHGYGVFSSFMSDWKYFGGVNVQEFKYKWGGEDSEMADRVVAKGIDIERLRLPDFYHFDHDKSGMWEQAN